MVEASFQSLFLESPTLDWPMLQVSEGGFVTKWNKVADSWRILAANVAVQEERIKQSNSQIDHWKQQATNLQNSLNVYTDRAHSDANAISRLQGIIDTMESDLYSADQDIRGFSDDKKTYQHLVGDIIASNDKWLRKLNKYSSGKETESDMEVPKLSQQGSDDELVQRFEVQWKFIHEEMEFVLQNVCGDYNELRSTVKNLEGSIAQLNAEKIKIGEDFAAYKEQEDDLDEVYKTVETKFNEMKAKHETEVSEISESLKSSNNSLKEAQETIESLKSSLSGIKSESSTFEAFMRYFCQRCSFLASQKIFLSRENHQLATFHEQITSTFKSISSSSSTSSSSSIGLKRPRLSLKTVALMIMAVNRLKKFTAMSQQTTVRCGNWNIRLPIQSEFDVSTISSNLEEIVSKMCSQQNDVHISSTPSSSLQSFTRSSTSTSVNRFSSSTITNYENTTSQIVNSFHQTFNRASQLEKQVSSLNMDLKEMRSKLTKFREESSQNQKLESQLKAECSVLNDRIKDLHERALGMRPLEEYQQLENLLASTRSDLEIQIASSRENDTELFELKTSQETLHQEINELKSMNTELQTFAQAIQDERDELVNKLTLALEREEQFDVENSKMRNELANIVLRSEELETICDRFRSELSVTRTRLADSLAEEDRLASQIRDIRLARSTSSQLRFVNGTPESSVLRTSQTSHASSLSSSGLKLNELQSPPIVPTTSVRNTMTSKPTLPTASTIDGPSKSKTGSTAMMYNHFSGIQKNHSSLAALGSSWNPSSISNKQRGILINKNMSNSTVDSFSHNNKANSTKRNVSMTTDTRRQGYNGTSIHNLSQKSFAQNNNRASSTERNVDMITGRQGNNPNSGHNSNSTIIHSQKKSFEVSETPSYPSLRNTMAFIGESINDSLHQHNDQKVSFASSMSDLESYTKQLSAKISQAVDSAMKSHGL
eukprot:TRINITY_DN1463_c2_g3_i1.p1 TRINITY_DN1463_c2_g3~~TRINITY_DN1463_c2_g3_i1.p1  ORF type:complete len:945 (+),score=263.43 TRINITY_DN1463_c2_g3_i1:1346-4180(+)